MFDRIEDTFNERLAVDLIHKYGQTVSFIARSDHSVIYAQTPKDRVIFARDNWGMSKEQLAEFIAALYVEDRKRYSYQTPSAFAASYWRKNYPTDDSVYLIKDGYKAELAKAAIYGGRNEVYQRGDETLRKYDINSSYPYHATLAALPVPGSLQYVKSATLRNILEYQGYSMIAFEQNELYPVLPQRIAGKGRSRTVYYCNGAQQGTYTHTEIRYALEHGYITNVTVLKQYIATRLDNPLRDFMIEAYERRLKHKVWKRIANALIGRFAIKDDSPPIQFRVATRDSDIPADRRLVMPINGRRWALVGQYMPGIPFSNPSWAAEILSAARVTLHKAIMQSKDPWYTDTDCVIAEDADLDIGPGLGQWKMQEEAYKIRAAKAYDSDSGPVWAGVSKHRDRVASVPYSNERALQSDGKTVPFFAEELR